MALFDVFMDALESAVVGKVDEQSTFATVGAVSAAGLVPISVKKTIRNEVKRVSGYARNTDIQALPVRTVTIPQNFAGLEAVDVPTRLAYQYFEIVDVDEQDGEVIITARHIWYENLRNHTLWKPTAGQSYSASQVCKNVLENAISPVRFEVATDCTDSLPADKLDFERKNIVEAFLDPENGICKKFGLSIIRDNARFYCLKNVGFDRGFVVESGKNMLGVERQENIENLSTRVAPIAKDSKGNIVWMNNNGLSYLDSQYINDYRDPYVEIYDTGLQIGKNDVTSDNVQAKLLEAAQKRYSEDKVDLPEVTMTVEFISLGDTEEYRQYRDLDKVYLYDIITIKDKDKGYNYSAQVIGVEHDVLTGMLKSVTIGSLKQADASRKIAVWQVPEVDGSNIRLLSIQAGSFEPGAIGSDDLQENIIQYAHFASATIDSLTTDALEAAAAHIHELIAGSITADDITAGSITTETLAADAVTAEKIAAGAITAEKIGANAVTAGKIAAGAIETEKLAAYAITSAKIAAGAITTDKIDAGAVTADKISATDINAINAKLGTATIAQAEIEVADINFAHIKDLNAQSAYFGQTIFDEGVGGKLYVPRLNVGYAQMVGATIGDLVIQASNGDFYGIDVDMNGNVTATKRTVSAGEIAAGHTSDGRTLVLGTDILATDLSTENIYASHALMNEITAAVINVDELWARQAFIGKLMTTDITSNTYIRSQVVDKIGNWTSSSTITQSINSLNSKISEMGYGTVYFQPNEPSHENLTEGDIWVKSSNVADWNDLYSRQEEGQYVFADWQAVYNAFDDWQTLCAVDRMFVWTGVEWKEMYDAQLPNTLETEINQLASEITLKASRTDVDFLANEVTEFSAQLTIQAEEIQSAVSAVNLKAASYVMQADPRTAYTVSVGDIWVKWDGVVDWTDIFNRYDDWQAVYNTFGDWSELIGSKSYVWNGFEWVETSSRASEIEQRTLIDQTKDQITLLAEASATLNDELYRTKAQLSITNSAIIAEVERATTAEGGKLDKTQQYQTAESIVTAAQSYVNGILTNKSVIEQTATGITAYVEEYTGENYYHHRSDIEIKPEGIEISGSKYIKIKSGGEFLVDSGKFHIDTGGNVTLTGTITANSITANQGGTIAGWTIAANRLSSGSGTKYVGLDSSANGEYAIWAGNSNPANAKFWVKRTGQAYFEGAIKAAADSTFGGWVLGSNNLHSGTGESYVCLASSGTYAIYAGNSNAGSAPFRVTPGGEVTLTKLKYLNANGTETVFNPRTGLWKLDYHTVKAYSSDSITLSNGAVINFIKASSLSVGGGAGKVSVLNAGSEVSGTSRTVVVGIDTEVDKTYSGGYTRFNAKAFFSAAGGATIVSSACVIEDKAGSGLAYDAGYTDGWGAAVGKVGSFSVTAGSGVVSIGVPSSTVGSSTTKSGTITLTQTEWSNGSKNITAKFAGSEARTTTVSIADSDVSGWSSAYVQNGQMSVSCFVGGKSISSGAINDPGYSYGKNDGYEAGEADGIAEYYNSSYWSKATAANNWTPKIPNSTNTAAEDWTDSGASDAYDAGAQAGFSGGYDAGYNKALGDAGVPRGGVVYSGGTSYARLYTLGEHGEAVLVGGGIIAPDIHILTPR